jgi:alkaline phosphatase D
MNKRRSPGDTSGQQERFLLAHGSSRRHHSLFLIVLGVSVVATLVVVLFAVTHVALSPSDEVLADARWLTPSEHGPVWQHAMHQQSLQNTPPAHGLSLNQVFFISCNRHDRSQAYWANIAVAAQCEVLSRSDRVAAPPCRRLYAGQTPLSRTGGVLTEEKRWVREAAPLMSADEVPLGACGTVYDTAAAALHRATHRVSAKEAAKAPSHAALRFPRSPLTVDVVPVDAVLWLGDAIYADKRADGQDGQSLLSHHPNSLAEVSHFWRIQRDAPEYTAFVTSCVATTADATPTLSNAPSNSTPLVEALGDDDGDDAHEAARDGAHVKALGQAEENDNTELVVPQPPTAVTPQHNVWGTWDDHDMGKNDGGKEYPYRNVTQRFFLDFLKAPANDPRWTREGVYDAYTLPFHTVVDNSKGWGLSLERLLNQLYVHAICVILLDVRSFRDPPTATYQGDMLGAAQWAWFEGQLQRFTTRTEHGREPCAVTLIGGGIQFMMDEKPAENWAAFPGARDRLLGLLRTYRAERVAFLTGDVHMGELGGDFTADAVERVLGYPLIEATSSGLTHSANMLFLPTLLPRFFGTPRRLALYVEKNFGAVRLSVDLLRLPTFRRYLNDTAAAPGLTVLPQTLEERQAVRDVVQRGLNVTLTIFSIPHHGQPVFRLNFPLSMLTYAHGADYLDATVDPYHGDVQLQSSPRTRSKSTNAPAVPTAVAFTNFQLKNGTVVTVPHYFITRPVPFVTWYSRLAQRYLLTRSSVSESLKWCLVAQFCVVVVLTSLFLLCGCQQLWRRLRQRSLHPPQLALSRSRDMPGDSSVFAQSSSSFSFSATAQQRWWNRLMQRFQKNKIG